MLTNIEKTGHYNLYFIFKEDKIQNMLSPNEISDIWRSIIRNYRETKKQSAKN